MTTESHAYKKTITVNVSAALVSTTLDSIIFYPLETLMRRLQLGEKWVPYSITEVRYFHRNVLSLYQGMGVTQLLKGVSRSFKYAGEPLIAGQLEQALPSINPVLLHTAAGAITGSLAALCMTPIDTLKINKQRVQNSTVSYKRLWQQQKKDPFKGTGVTLLRNSIGTATFFAANSFLRHSIFKCQKEEPLSAHQKMINSTVCPLFGILASYPADLVKTHIQSSAFPAGIKETAGRLISKKGFSGLYHGLLFKLVTVAPRASIGFWLYQTLEEQFRLYAENEKPAVSLFFSAGKKQTHADGQEKAEDRKEGALMKRG